MTLRCDLWHPVLHRPWSHAMSVFYPCDASVFVYAGLIKQKRQIGGFNAGK